MFHICLVHKYQKTGSRETLVAIRLGSRRFVIEVGNEPLPGADRPTPGDNHPLVDGLSHQQPRQVYLSFRNSFSNRSAMFSARPRPLVQSVLSQTGGVILLTNIELVSVNPVRISSGISARTTHPMKSIVLIIKPNVGLTVVTSSFIIRFTMVVLPALSRPLRYISREPLGLKNYPYSIRIRISLSFKRAFRSIDNMVSELPWLLGLAGTLRRRENDLPPRPRALHITLTIHPLHAQLFMLEKIIEAINYYSVDVFLSLVQMIDVISVVGAAHRPVRNEIAASRSIPIFTTVTCRCAQPTTQ